VLAQLSFVLLSINIQVTLENLEKRGTKITLTKLIEDNCGSMPGRISASKLKEIIS
jgi:hypothetical protein